MMGTFGRVFWLSFFPRRRSPKSAHHNLASSGRKGLAVDNLTTPAALPSPLPSQLGPTCCSAMAPTVMSLSSSTSARPAAPRPPSAPRAPLGRCPPRAPPAFARVFTPVVGACGAANSWVCSASTEGTFDGGCERRRVLLALSLFARFDSLFRSRSAFG